MNSTSIRSFHGIGQALGHPHPLSALPLVYSLQSNPLQQYYTLYLNRFRGKPAISEFD